MTTRSQTHLIRDIQAPLWDPVSVCFYWYWYWYLRHILRLHFDILGYNHRFTVDVDHSVDCVEQLCCLNIMQHTVWQRVFRLSSSTRSVLLRVAEWYDQYLVQWRYGISTSTRKTKETFAVSRWSRMILCEMKQRLYGRVVKTTETEFQMALRQCYRCTHEKLPVKSAAIAPFVVREEKVVHRLRIVALIRWRSADINWPVLPPIDIFAILLQLLLLDRETLLYNISFSALMRLIAPECRD